MPTEAPLTPMSMALLVALGAGDLHSYALLREIEVRSEGRLRPGTGSLYAALQRLMEEGLIAESPTRPPGDDDARRMQGLLDEARRSGLIPAPKG